jgi:uncharacterized protein (TIGR03083 family)
VVPVNPGTRTSLTDLIDAWAASAADLRSVAAGVGEAGWRAPSALPGWSVGDVVAHVGWIERHLLGLVDPPHEPDWSGLPHVTSPISRVTEVPVDLRRSWPREQVLAEYDAAIAARETALRAGPQDPGTPSIDPFGRPKPLGAVLRMRIFDAWVHGQDVRRAVRLPGIGAPAGARFTAEQIAGGLGFVWSKRVGAPAGSTLTVHVTGPDVELAASVAVAEDGRGGPIPEPDSPTVSLTLTFDDFVQLGCGREWPGSTTEDARARVEVAGDAELAARTLDSFNIAP